MNPIQDKKRMFVITENLLNRWDELIMDQQNLFQEILSNFEFLIPFEKEDPPKKESTSIIKVP